jgi:hypothetical protein
MPQLVSLLSEPELEISAVNSFLELAIRGANIASATAVLRKKLSSANEDVARCASKALSHHFITFYDSSELDLIFSSIESPIRDGCGEALTEACANGKSAAIEFIALKMRSRAQGTRERAGAILSVAAETGTDEAKTAIAATVSREMDGIKASQGTYNLHAFRLLTNIQKALPQAAE